MAYIPSGSNTVASASLPPQLTKDIMMKVEGKLRPGLQTKTNCATVLLWMTLKDTHGDISAVKGSSSVSDQVL